MAVFFFKRYDKQRAHSQDFSKVGGDYTVPNRGYSQDCHVNLSTVSSFMWQKRLTKGITGTPRPPPPPTHLPSYTLWHSYWAACFRHSMRNRSQNGHDEKKLGALDWWVHFQKRLSKGGSQEARNPSTWQYVKPLSKWAPQEKAQSYRPVGLFSLSELTWGHCERHESSHWNCHIYSQTN